MVAVRDFPSPSLSPSPSPPPWLSLVCRLVIVLTPSPLVLSTLPQPQPLLINAPPPLVRWRISSRLPLFAGWLSRRLLSRCLRLASPFVAQPPLTSILDPPSLSVPAGCCVPSCRTTSASRHAAGSRCLLQHLRLKSASSPSLAPPFSSHPLLAPRPSPASSNARRTLPATSSPTASVPSRTVLVLQHVRLRAGSRVASCGTFALNPPARPLSHHHFRRPLSRRRGHRPRPQMHGALSWRRHRQRQLFPLVRLSSSNTFVCVAASSSLQLNHPLLSFERFQQLVW